MCLRDFSLAIFHLQFHVVFRSLSFLFCIMYSGVLPAQPRASRLVTVDSGWAKNSVNVVIFRKNSLVSFGHWQYIAYYNKDGFVVLGKRKLNRRKWELRLTPYKGNTADAHNAISIMVDGDGFLHMAWNHHNNNLHYVRSTKPGSLELGREIPMTGSLEDKVSYPEFYRMPDGDLVFFYRDGGSGKGNLVVNRYNRQTKTWTQLHRNLIDGEGKRNAYWQACVGANGAIHLSWVWRESASVESNHDMAYACSKDGGKTWQKSGGEAYRLPINVNTAEYAVRIPEGSALMNQTSMAVDEKGHPCIATYWREKGGVPQYRVIYRTKDGWHADVVGNRTTPFTLAGTGTKRTPMARPQIVAWTSGQHLSAAMIFRDEERGNKISVAINNHIGSDKWTVADLTQLSVGSWEPTYDTELWKEKGRLHLFVQKVEQADAESLSSLLPQMINVLELDPKKTMK